MNLQVIKNNYIKSELAQKLYANLKELLNDENFTTGVVVNCETDENIKKMLSYMENKNPTPKEILLYSIKLDK